MYIYARGGKYVTKYQQHFPLSHVVSIMTTEEESEEEKTERDFIMHASRKETPDCEREKQHATIHAPRPRG
jgi:hypothetical protein